MRVQSQAIVDAGFGLQHDCPDLALSRHTVFAHLSLEEFQRVIAIHVEALNYADRDLPPERLRVHICWGSTMAPTTLTCPRRTLWMWCCRGVRRPCRFPLPTRGTRTYGRSGRISSSRRAKFSSLA